MVHRGELVKVLEEVHLEPDWMTDFPLVIRGRLSCHGQSEPCLLKPACGCSLCRAFEHSQGAAVHHHLLLLTGRTSNTTALFPCHFRVRRELTVARACTILNTTVCRPRKYMALSHHGVLPRSQRRVTSGSPSLGFARTSLAASHGRFLRSLGASPSSAESPDARKEAREERRQFPEVESSSFSGDRSRPTSRGG